MLNKIKENCYALAVNVRESFTFEIDLDNYRVIIDYYCKTDNYHYISSFEFEYQSPDPSNIARQLHIIIDKYLTTNIISGSVRRVFIKFRDEICALYNNYSMASMFLG